MQRSRPSAATRLLGLLLAAPPAGAGHPAQLAGVRFDREIQVEGTDLPLRSLGLTRRLREQLLGAS